LVPMARRTLEELTEDLDPRAGDRASTCSAFWTMLVLSSLIAAAGVMADSTAGSTLPESPGPLERDAAFAQRMFKAAA
jgi:hypothetical protein